MPTCTVMATAERARRFTNIISELKPVHSRLTRWGGWWRGVDGLPRAWPVVTLLGRVMEGGPDWAVGKSFHSHQMPEDVERVNEAVMRLDGLHAAIVRKYYLGWAAPEVMARELRVPLRTFQEALRCARYQVRGYLHAIEQSNLPNARTKRRIGAGWETDPILNVSI